MRTVNSGTSLVFLLLTLMTSPGRSYTGGTGDRADPFLIETARDLFDLSSAPADWNKHFRLVSDIDLAPGLPGNLVFDRAVIGPDDAPEEDGYQGTPFTGTFDGNHHVIRNLTISGRSYLGLFGRLQDEGQIRNLGVVDANVVGTGEHIAILVGYSRSALVVGSHTTGSVVGDRTAGGLIGGNWLGGTVHNCYSISTLKAGVYVGGLIGGNAGSVISSYSTGVLTGERSIGGLIGSSAGLVINSYSTGVASGREKIGGLIGDNEGHISNSYSATVVIGESRAGGLVGNNTGRASNSFWDIDVSGVPTSAAGLGLSTTDMCSADTYLDAGWDFLGETSNGLHESWQMPEGGGYPVLCVFGGLEPPPLSGQGTQEDPYLISTPADLGAVTYHDRRACYRLTADIDLSGITWSVAVIPEFGGTFEGKEFAIRNLTISGGGYLGVFGLLQDRSQVSGLRIPDANVVGVGNNIGILTGYNRRGNIVGCSASGIINGHENIGGLAGVNWGNVEKCRSGGAIDGHAKIGGLVGDNAYGSVNNSYTTSEVCGSSAVGGLVGYNGSGLIEDSYSAGIVVGAEKVGGLVGENGTETGRVDDSFWNVETSGLSASAGGEGLNTAQMTDIEVYLDVGWDFVGESINGIEDVWYMVQDSYPHLTWEDEHIGLLEDAR